MDAAEIIVVVLILILVFLLVYKDSCNGKEKDIDLSVFLKNREGWISRPGRDTHQGSYADPYNLLGKLGHNKPTGDFESKEDAYGDIMAVLEATSTLESTTDPGRNRSPDQIFMFHDELEGVRDSLSGKKIGRVWTPSEFLSKLEVDGYTPISYPSEMYPQYKEVGWRNVEKHYDL